MTGTRKPAERGVRKVAVVGGSISGLLVALLLRRQGCEVDIYEQSRMPLAGRGAGIVTHAALNVALAAVGLPGIGTFAHPIACRRVYARDGAIVADRAFPQMATSWERLFDLLRAGFPDRNYHSGKSLAGLHGRPGGMALGFVDGSSAEADLVVGADGFRSTARRIVLPDVQPIYAGYVAWRGLVEESEISRAAREALFDSLSFCLPEGEQIVGYPVAAPAPGGPRRFNFVWYRPAGERGALRQLLTDAGGRTHALSIPPPLIKESDVAAMRADAEAKLAPLFVEIVRLAKTPFLQPIYDLAVPKMAFGRLALVGDAAFLARPHVGAGVSKAADDAMSLARCLVETAGPDEALIRFSRERTAVGERIIRRARRLGAYLQAERGTEEERAAAERHRTADAVLAETASVAFLDEPETP